MPSSSLVEVKVEVGVDVEVEVVVEFEVEVEVGVEVRFLRFKFSCCLYSHGWSGGRLGGRKIGG